MRLGDVAAVAALELRLFPYDAFSAASLRDELAVGPTRWWVVVESGAPEPARVPGSPPARGHLLGAAGVSLAEDSEILSLAVAPEAHRQGIGRALLAELVDRARGAGAERIFLEVADDNAPALALYAATGFETISRRRGYYASAAGPGTVDALVLARRPDGRPGPSHAAAHSTDAAAAAAAAAATGTAGTADAGGGQP